MKQNNKASQNRRDVIKSAGLFGTLSLLPVSQATSTQNNRRRFIEYYVYGEVQDTDDAFLSHSDSLPAHQQISSDQILMDERLLNDEEITLFNGNRPIAWSDGYDKLPVTRSEGDPYPLVHPPETGGRPTLYYMRTESQQPIPPVHIDSNESGVSVRVKNESSTVPDGSEQTISFESHSEQIEANTQKSAEVEVTPLVYIRNFGNVEISWVEDYSPE